MIRTGPCERGVIMSTPAVPGVCPQQAKTWILAAAILGSGMVAVDGGAVSVGLPIIQTDLAVPLSALLWVVNAYSLGLAALMLIGGAAGDYYGQRRIFVLGVSIFTLASILCGLAASASQLITARALQGIGGALLVPTNLAIIGTVFSEKERGKAIGTWAALSAIIAALGPVVGGWLIDAVSWRAIFFLNVPLAMVTLFIAWRFMPNTRNPDSARNLDWPGAALGAAALAALALGLTEAGNRGWLDPLVVGALVAASLLLCAFVATEWRSTNPMIPLSLFRSRNFNGANLLTLFLYAALTGVYFLLPFNLIHVQEFTAAATGAVFLPVTLLIAGLSRWSGAVQDRIGARWPLVGGPLITAAGCVLLALTDADGSYWTDFLPAMLTVGLGVAIIVSPLTASVLNAVSRTRSGIASGINNSVEEVSNLLAVALFGTIALVLFQQALSSHLLLAGVDASQVSRTIEEIGQTLAVSEVPSFLDQENREDLKAVVTTAFLDSFRMMMLAAAGVAVLSALVAAVMIDPGPVRAPTRKRELGKTIASASTPDVSIRPGRTSAPGKPTTDPTAPLRDTVSMTIDGSS